MLDPAITVHTPEWLWLSTGIRAVDHCVEGICSAEANPYADAQALHGLSLLTRGLPRVKADPADIEARLDCQIGSWLSMGPLASGVPMGASHGIGYVLGAAFDIPHGHTSCIMPAVMRWNKPANAEHWSRRRWATRARMPAMCSTPSSPGSACRAASARSRSARRASP
jgi:alcohol dehydrogenase class IV